MFVLPFFFNSFFISLFTRLPFCSPCIPVMRRSDVIMSNGSQQAADDDDEDAFEYNKFGCSLRKGTIQCKLFIESPNRKYASLLFP